MTLSQLHDAAPIVGQYGFAGMVLWIVVRWLQRIDHTLRGLSMALWMDLATRENSSEFTKGEAKRVLARMEGEKK